MTDYIIILLLIAIWFQGTNYSRALSSDISALIRRFKK
jgi:hypothetical protein